MLINQKMERKEYEVIGKNKVELSYLFPKYELVIMSYDYWACIVEKSNLKKKVIFILFNERGICDAFIYRYFFFFEKIKL